MKRRLSELKPHEVLRVAICVERRNHAIYVEYAALFEGYDAEAVQIFREMAQEEQAHAEQLERLYQGKFAGLDCPLTDQEIAEAIEAPILEDAEVFVFDSMRPARCFEVAFKAEVGARDFYGQLAELTRDEDLKRLYRELAGFEVDHVQRVERKMRAYQERQPPPRGGS